jgi:hypothetical protein
MFNMKRIKWALRKIQLPVSSSGLVLDVGSGGNPYPRSDVLLDRLTGAEHRCGVPMMIDRPTVFADASKMPFKDKAFDFVIASHILEHVSDPAGFLDELQRIGKAGYIETPNFIFERLFPYEIHCLEIALVDHTLHIHKKRQPVEDDFLGNLGFLKDDKKWKNYFSQSPDMFHVTYYWNGEISYVIKNPEVSCEWIEKTNQNNLDGAEKKYHFDFGRSWRGWGLWALSLWQKYKRKKRLEGFNLHSILVCPKCKGRLKEESAGFLVCNSCKIKFNALPNPDFCNPVELNHSGAACTNDI